MTKAFILRFLAKTVATMILPASFIALMLFALTQSFGIALVIFISLIIVQTILSEKYEIFSWGEYSSLSFSRDNYSSEERMSKALNILFNLTKLVLIFAFMRLIIINSEYTNPFGKLGYAITISFTFILTLIYIFKRGRHHYDNLRGILSLVTTIVIGVFAYLFFGAQMIWFALLLQFVLGYVFLACFEIEEKFKFEKYSFSTVTVAILLITATVSTIIQFWSNIADLMIRFWGHVVAISLYQLIPGFDLYLMVFGTLGFVLLVYLIFRFIKRRESRKVAYAKLLQEEAEKQERKEKEETEKRREKQAEEQRVSDIKADIIAIIAQAQSGTISNNQFAYLAKNRNLLELEIPIKSLSSITLKDAFQISTLKKQITWHHDLEDVLILINNLYSRSYKDEELELLIKIIKDLYSFLFQYHDYLGYEIFTQVVEKIIKSIPAKHYRY